MEVLIEEGSFVGLRMSMNTRSRVVVDALTATVAI